MRASPLTLCVHWRCRKPRSRRCQSVHSRENRDAALGTHTFAERPRFSDAPSVVSERVRRNG